MKRNTFRSIGKILTSSLVFVAANTGLAQTSSGKLYFSETTEDKISLYGNRFNSIDMYGIGVGQSTLYSKSKTNHAFLINKNVAAGATMGDIYKASTFWFSADVMRFQGPQPRLTIQDNSATNPTFSARLYLLKTGTEVNGGYLLYHGTADYLSLGTVNNEVQNPAINIKHSNRYVGIGTVNPIMPLHVEASTAFLQRLKRTSATGDLTALVEIENGSGVNWRYGVGGSGNGLDIESGQFYIEKTGSGAAMVITSGKNVLINKTSQSNSAYRLDVNGEVRANGVTVNTTGADFVFASDYKLNKLEDVERFIKANHHLPEIPSAKEMTENGMNVGELNKQLLQKVEELTLYIIDLNKQIQELKK